jgi:hypothetical protein
MRTKEKFLEMLMLRQWIESQLLIFGCELRPE